MALTRVVAVVRSGGELAPQSSKVVIYGAVVDGRLAAGIWPGVHEEQGRRWPFALKVTAKGVAADYGSGYDPRQYGTNIHEKTLRPGELFTLAGVGGSSAYQVTVCHAFEPQADIRLAQVEAPCIDAKRAKSHLVFIGPVDRQHRLVEGVWLGFSEDKQGAEPFSFEPGKQYLDYGTDWFDSREKTDFSSAQPGAAFSVHSWDKAGRPDEWRYSVASCEFL